MQTAILESLLQTQAGQEADPILRSCVHCGFCTATCPTYQLLGDELDGPRGRIYLIKQMLEGQPVGEHTQRHLDRCLTCRACETTCPSGVQYGRLLDIGREMVEERVPRPMHQRLSRWLLRKLVPYPGRFALLLGLARAFRFLLPARLDRKIPPAVTQSVRPMRSHGRRVLLLEGCAQSSATPQTNDATVRVLDRLGITAVCPKSQGCCGALSQHLGAGDEARGFMRRNIDAWWPHIASGAEAILITASGCGVTVKDYATLLAGDPEYAEKAKRVSDLAKDVSEMLAVEDLAAWEAKANGTRVAFHAPCTLQHGQKLNGVVEGILLRLGFELTEVDDAHLCCGSAGSYSLLQPEISRRLRDNKLGHLGAGAPELIVTANVGCQLHLIGGADIPVKHWIELLDGLGD